jgi:hypothetical protein
MMTMQGVDIRRRLVDERDSENDDMRDPAGSKARYAPAQATQRRLPSTPSAS